jgi:hypothetical protein
MCGIVGYIGKRRAVPIILDGLRRLEYRGYDSAGLAVLNEGGELVVRRASGKLRNLEEVIRLDPVDGAYGIGHTRWATHGRPTEQNAHPHSDCHGDVVVVHNGIIENYIALKHQLEAEGHLFRTETDTEVIAHLKPCGRPPASSAGCSPWPSSPARTRTRLWPCAPGRRRRPAQRFRGPPGEAPGPPHSLGPHPGREGRLLDCGGISAQPSRSAFFLISSYSVFTL